ncbi:hypothetical protein ACHAW6_003116, partial [Cyclotella cf. meneghiniana]
PNSCSTQPSPHQEHISSPWTSRFSISVHPWNALGSCTSNTTCCHKRLSPCMVWPERNLTDGYMSEFKKACIGSCRRDSLPTNLLPVTLMQMSITNANSHWASGTKNGASSHSAL